MPHAENTVTVDRPIGDVFAYLADGANNLRWRSGIQFIERTSAGDGVGATHRQKLRGPGSRTIDGDYRVTASQPPTYWSFASSPDRPARPDGSRSPRHDRAAPPSRSPRPAADRADAADEPNDREDPCGPRSTNCPS
jgi:Polyketide cyclase / dehydrase and lipid transport